jgi:hypothetical protein
VSSQPEVEWDATERAWMLALEHYRAHLLCPCGCGYTTAVAHDQDTENKVHVPPPTRCHVRTAIGRAQEAYGKEPGARPEGLLWGATVGL